nr:PREDICTED: uncharacterized protein LOC100883897 [Megachile rotundata]
MAAGTEAATDIASLQVSLPQMLDLALGTPEVGAVNLNILHNFLHVLLHQINLQSIKVEYRGDDANRVQTMVSSLKTGPSLHLQEYSIIDANNEAQPAPTDDPANIQVDVVRPEDLKSKGTRQAVSPAGEGEPEKVIFVEPIVDGATPTALGFKRLEQSVNELRQRFQALEELATTPELVERVKGKLTDPVTDVWQIISITNRLDASEQGIDKLTKMMQDVLKGETTVVAAAGSEADTSTLENRLSNLERELDTLSQVVKNLQIISDKGEEEGEETEVGGAPATSKDEGQPAHRISLSQLLGGIDVKQMSQDVSTLQAHVAQMKDELHGLNEKLNKSQSELVAYISTEQKKHEPSKEHEQEQTPKTSVDEHSQATEEKSDIPAETPKKASKSADKDSPKPSSRKATAESGKTEETADTEELGELKQRVGKLEKDVVCLFEKVESAPMAGVSGNAELDELVSKIQGIQNDMDKLHQTADRLIDDRENREIHLNALLEQVELLKTIKADREDLEDALADKADAQAINRKVSYDQFDAACDDLAQGLEDAISKLGKQESIWQQAMDEVQREIEGKVDKIEMTPLKDFVNTRLKSLQDKVKSVAQMRQDDEAAGAKKLLKDIQCISCDKNVVMKTEDTHKFKPDTLPCTGSMKPYLTYELDQVRKQHRRLPHSRNMLQFEAALQEEARKQKIAKADNLVKTPRDHLCNRYCGGSHTVTTPQQRVMRMGHFLTQWGPEIIQLTEGMIKGTDGKMYKSRPMPGKFDVCGPGYCDDHGDEVRPSEKSPTSALQVQRKSVEKQPAAVPKRKSAKKQPRELSTEVIEELAESPAEEAERHVSDMMYDSPDQVIRYMDDEEMEDLE